ncbi:hypothetical protein Hanom_Chr17g01585461 [Helianthus anomalus]
MDRPTVRVSDHRLSLSRLCCRKSGVWMWLPVTEMMTGVPPVADVLSEGSSQKKRAVRAVTRQKWELSEKPPSPPLPAVPPPFPAVTHRLCRSPAGVRPNLPKERESDVGVCACLVSGFKMKE